MGIPRLSLPFARTALVLPVLVALSACATVGRSGAQAGAARADAPETEVERGPRVQIWTSEEVGSRARVQPLFRLQDDAYVIVVNVDLDGYARVIFPESPEDDGFMRAGRTYRLPGFFPGFATPFRATSYRRAYNAVAAYDDIYDRYAGYVFIIASWRPMHFQLAEASGFWDEHRLATHERHLEPYQVMHAFAERLVGRQSRDYTARFARYSAFRGGFASRPYSAFCSLHDPIAGYIPWPGFYGGGWRIPSFGFYGARSNCGFAYGLAAARPFSRPIARPVRPLTPVRPPAIPRIPGPITRPPRGEEEKPPTQVGEEAGKRGRTKGRTREHAADEETIVDVTRETRETAGRRNARGDTRATWGERGYQPASGWSRAERAGRSRRAEGSADRGSDRAGRREPAERSSSSRPESSRGAERRSTEPRRESAPRPEARPRPAERSQPARSESRGERPAPRPRDQR